MNTYEFEIVYNKQVFSGFYCEVSYTKRISSTALSRKNRMTLNINNITTPFTEGSTIQVFLYKNGIKELFFDGTILKSTMSKERGIIQNLEVCQNYDTVFKYVEGVSPKGSKESVLKDFLGKAGLRYSSIPSLKNNTELKNSFRYNDTVDRILFYLLDGEDIQWVIKKDDVVHFIKAGEEKAINQYGYHNGLLQYTPTKVRTFYIPTINLGDTIAFRLEDMTKKVSILGIDCSGNPKSGLTMELLCKEI